MAGTVVFKCRDFICVKISRILKILIQIRFFNKILIKSSFQKKKKIIEKTICILRGNPYDYSIEKLKDHIEEIQFDKSNDLNLISITQSDLCL